jgi:hypothetical protein
MHFNNQRALAALRKGNVPEIRGLPSGKRLTHSPKSRKSHPCDTDTTAASSDTARSRSCIQHDRLNQVRFFEVNV